MAARHGETIIRCIMRTYLAGDDDDGGVFQLGKSALSLGGGVAICCCVGARNGRDEASNVAGSYCSEATDAQKPRSPDSEY